MSDFLPSARDTLANLEALQNSGAYARVFLGPKGVHAAEVKQAEEFFAAWKPTADATKLQQLSAHVLAWQAARAGLTWLDDQIRDLQRQIAEHVANHGENPPQDSPGLA